MAPRAGVAATDVVPALESGRHRVCAPAVRSGVHALGSMRRDAEVHTAAGDALSEARRAAGLPSVRQPMRIKVLLPSLPDTETVRHQVDTTTEIRSDTVYC